MLTIDLGFVSPRFKFLVICGPVLGSISDINNSSMRSILGYLCLVSSLIKYLPDVEQKQFRDAETRSHFRNTGRTHSTRI